MADLWAYLSLFFAAFFAATILPAQSETVLAGLLLTDRYIPWLLIAVASVGNILGSVVNWGLGLGIERFRRRPWFPVRQTALERAQIWYRRYGKWSLLLSWMPIVGDPLTVVAGILREPFHVFLILVSVAKIGRYLVIAGLTLGFI